MIEGIMPNLFFILFLCAYAYAITDEEVKVEFTKFVMKCTEEHPVEISELFQLQKLIPPTDTKTKCLLACAYKREGTMNSKGLYDIEHAYQVAELSKNGDEKRLINGRKLADQCAKVNEMKVSTDDEEKGCERAALMFKCLVENAPKFGFKV